MKGILFSKNAEIKPWMAEGERELFATHIKKTDFLLEFGCGGSTVLAAQLGTRKIISVESDRKWLAKISRDPAVKLVDFMGFHVDIGPTGAWGYPKTRRYVDRWANYPLAVWKVLPEKPDTVFIDGRFRVACCLQALLHGRPDTKIIIHDFWNRDQYHVLLKYLTCIEKCETLGVFNAKPDIDWKSLALQTFEHASECS